MAVRATPGACRGSLRPAFRLSPAYWPSQKQVSSRLSQMELITRGMPCERCVNFSHHLGRKNGLVWHPALSRRVAM